jgi:hypothetical protein
MKTCTYCGRDNDDTLVACRECGTEFTPAEPVTSTATLSRRGRIIAALVVVFVLVVAFIAMPALLLAVPVFALFFLPIYLPFLLSFAIKSHEWRGLRWSLRVGSVLALFIRLCGVSGRPDFGDDVAGNIGGASHNFAWTWGSGVGCALAAVIAGLLFRVVLPAPPRVSSEQASHTGRSIVK